MVNIAFPRITLIIDAKQNFIIRDILAKDIYLYQFPIQKQGIPTILTPPPTQKKKMILAGVFFLGKKKKLFFFFLEGGRDVSIQYFTEHDVRCFVNEGMEHKEQLFGLFRHEWPVLPLGVKKKKLFFLTELFGQAEQKTDTKSMVIIVPLKTTHINRSTP